MAKSSTLRFSDRVEDYIRYRPGYPAAVIGYLREKAGLTDQQVIADIGSGTGISAKLFLDNGNKVWAIEPNREMRVAAERLLSHYPNFTSADGTAGNLPLQDKSIDMIIACQAFHWFDIPAARKEFERVLKPGAYIVLIWNDRKTDNDEFAKEYEAALNTQEDYRKVNHKNVDRPAFDEFFGKDNYQIHLVPNHQEFDWKGLQGRLMSSSYVPAAGEPAHEPFMLRMKDIFDRHNLNGKIRLDYDVKLVCGRIF